MQLTKNFRSEEFSSKDGKDFPEDVLINIKVLAHSLQIIRDELGVPITITSGYRSEEHNRKIKGAVNSQHVKGTAADFKAQGLEPRFVFEVVDKLICQKKIPQGGLKAYSSWVHYDIRGVKARW